MSELDLVWLLGPVDSCEHKKPGAAETARAHFGGSSSHVPSILLWESLLRDLRHQQCKGRPGSCRLADLAGARGQTRAHPSTPTTASSPALLRAYPDHRGRRRYTTDDINASPPVGHRLVRGRYLYRSISGYNQFFEWATLRRRIVVSPMGLVAKVGEASPQDRHRDLHARRGRPARGAPQKSPTRPVRAPLRIRAPAHRSGGAQLPTRPRRPEPRPALRIPRRQGRQVTPLIPLMPSAIQAVADLDLTERLNADDYLSVHPSGRRRWSSSAAGRSVLDTTFARWYSSCVATAVVSAT